MTEPAEDEFTELTDATIGRVDLVDKAANGLAFLIAKQADGATGLLGPDLVRELIAKAEPEQPAAADEQVTVTGSPAAIAKLIHQAAVAKAKYNADDLRHMAANGEAMDDESYPIADREDLARAIRAVGRGGADHDAIRRHILTRAKALGAASEIPDNWNSDGSLKGPVAKTMELDDSTGSMDPTVPLAAPEEDAPGDPNDPGSPAWEAIDAATARKWTAILARAKVAVDMLAEREMLEAASGDEDDMGNAFDLEDACCAIDYAISVLAPFAVDEQSAADSGEMMAAVGKALGAFDPALLDTIEVLAPVCKAGRVLSTANEAAIRGAVEQLQKVLTSLPQAPTDDTEKDSGRPVAKTANEEPNMPQPTPSADATEAAGQEPAMGAAEAAPRPVAGQVITDTASAMAKAKTPQVAVYDQNGNLVGTVDPEEITMLAPAEAPAEAADAEPAAAAPASPDASDLTPAPAAEVGTPADAAPDDADITKQTDTTDTENVLKSIAKDAATAALDAYSATQEEVIAKQATGLAQLAERVNELTAMVKALEEQPATPKVFTNGAVPPRDQLRGQDTGARHVDTAGAREMKKSLYSADAPEQQRIATQMQGLAIAELQEIHHQRR